MPAMENAPIPEDIRRFVLTSVPSVPFLEALLLLRGNPAQQWHTDTVARRLYVRDKVAHGLLLELCTAGFAAPCDAPAVDCFRYAPSTDELRGLVERLAELYSRHLVEVTHLIHSTLDRKAQQFADAFRWRKDT